MQFEHIVQVNDLEQPEIPPLTRKQLWDGLVCRAREPNLFVVGLDWFKILDDQGDYLKRRLELPGLTVEDEVWLQPEEQLEYRIAATDTVPGGSLTMHIEEPQPGALFVRFRYCTQHQDLNDEALPYDLFVQQAYMATDIETIQLIRKWAQQ